MPKPRLNIIQLMAIVLLIGIGIAALREINRKNFEIALLSVRIKQMGGDHAREIEQMGGDHAREKVMLTTIIRELRDQVERPMPTLDIPDGRVTAVDYERREVVLDITSRQGVRPQLRMSIFDSASPDISNGKPKGNIQVTHVGESSSTARIIMTNGPIESIRVGDHVYSPYWSPDGPARFALVGMMDVNRDGKDDRDELKRMIQEAGGSIDFDLPPPDVGQEAGTLMPVIDWYVTDDRTRPEAQFAKRMGQVIKEARFDGIRPMPIGRLLASLGYDMRKPVSGRP
jgi:hypothetical protein